MKTTLIAVLAVGAFAMGIAGTKLVATDPEQVVINEIAELQKSKDELATKKYSGTIVQVMSQRVVDVNVVHGKSTKVIDDAAVLLAAKGMVVPKREMIVGILQKDREKIKDQKGNAEFLKVINEELDPKKLDPNDPNYISDLETNTDLIMWVNENVKPY